MVVVAESATSVVVAEALADHDVTTVESITDVSVGPDTDTDVVVLSLSVPGADAFSTYASVPLIGIGSADGSTADFYQLLEEPLTQLRCGPPSSAFSTSWSTSRRSTNSTHSAGIALVARTFPPRPARSTLLSTRTPASGQPDRDATAQTAAPVSTARFRYPVDSFRMSATSQPKRRFVSIGRGS
ncbi:hypothetical protein ACFQH3_12255 [Haladaptatus sp. GCM10025707]|uniref:hypothetical protein n=1 Tax=Haladaptatus sp. GCM10025707 TaxID=3252658 RepID=UPI0036106796